MEIGHSGTILSFDAIISDDGRQIDIHLRDGSRHQIKIEEGKSPLEGIMPSVEGEVLYCLHQDGSETFMDTVTGEILTFPQVSERHQRWIQV